MTIADKLKESRGLCRDIDSDLEQLQSLNGARNPERSSEILDHISCVTLHELRAHINELLTHYERRAKK